MTDDIAGLGRGSATNAAFTLVVMTAVVDDFAAAGDSVWPIVEVVAGHLLYAVHRCATRDGLRLLHRRNRRSVSAARCRGNVSTSIWRALVAGSLDQRGFDFGR